MASKERERELHGEEAGSVFGRLNWQGNLALNVEGEPKWSFEYFDKVYQKEGFMMERWTSCKVDTFK
jgi:hypothetical protein